MGKRSVRNKKYHCQISLPKDLDPLGAQGLGLNVAKNYQNLVRQAYMIFLWITLSVHSISYSSVDLRVSKLHLSFRMSSNAHILRAVSGRTLW
jgi:hypothetical protein